MGEYLEYPTDPRANLTGSRRGLLGAFGVLAIVTAVAGAAVVALSASAYVRIATSGRVSFPPRVTAGVILANFALLALAGGVAWGGVAMVRCRRWVITIGQVVSALALTVGLIRVETLIADYVIAEEFIDGGAGETATSAIMIAAVLVLGVALPLGYLAVLSGARVRRTFEAYDPYPVWTDRYPRPVLFVGVASFYLGLLAASWVGEETAFCFGRFVTGSGVVVMSVAWSAALLLTAAACAARSRLAWWMAGALVVLYAVAMLTTLWLGDPRALFGDASLLPSNEYEQRMLQQWAYSRINQTVLCVGVATAALVWLVRTRACVFDREEPSTFTSTAPAAIPAPSVDAAAGARILTPDDPPAD